MMKRIKGIWQTLWGKPLPPLDERYAPFALELYAGRVITFNTKDADQCMTAIDALVKRIAELEERFKVIRKMAKESK